MLDVLDLFPEFYDNFVNSLEITFNMRDVSHWQEAPIFSKEFRYAPIHCKYCKNNNMSLMGIDAQAISKQFVQLNLV